MEKLVEVYFLLSRGQSCFLPSSNVVYLISWSAGNYVQNLCDPLSLLSYASSDKHTL